MRDTDFNAYSVRFNLVGFNRRLYSKTLGFKRLIKFTRRHVTRNKVDFPLDFISRPICAIRSKNPARCRCARSLPCLQAAADRSADNERARVAALARPPRRCRRRKIAYQAWEEDRSVDPGVVLAASLGESGHTAR